ncbi:MAG: hypothetical protein MSA09_05180 [Lachnospiraceae bacterium]|nr:hypothetical protein [Lachnospiraceae bacterium]
MQSFKNWWQVIILGLGIIILGIVVFINNQKTTINLEEFVRADFYGYDSVGEGYYYIDKDKLPEFLGDSIYVIPDYAKNLSNGDRMNISIYYDTSLAEEYDIELTGEQVTVEVSGLKEPVEVDPFDGFSLEPYGFSPFGMAEFSYHGDHGYIKADDFHYYYSDDAMSLKNGDTVTIEYIPSEDPILYGYKITEYSKEFQIEGLDEYVQSFDELPESFLEYEKEETVDCIDAYTANYSEFIGMSPLDYAGYIYKVKKSDDAAGEYNVLYLIYKSCLSHELGNFEEQDIYYPVKFTDLLSSNGQVTATKSGIQGYTKENYETKGYRKPTLAYKELAEDSEDSYHVMAGDGFEIFQTNHYIYSVSDISNDVMQILEDRAVMLVNEYLNESDDFGRSKETKPVLEGGYWLVSKKQSNLKETRNQLILVYSSTITDDDESNVLYLPVIYEDLEIYPNGEFSYLDRYLTDNYCGINYSWANHTQGYIDEKRMYNDLVKTELNSYNEEVFGSLNAY